MAARMDGIFPELTRRFEVSKLLGYLNFSDGRPDAKFRRLVADVFGYLGECSDANPWQTVSGWLKASLDELERIGAGAFRDVSQARAVLTAACEFVPIAYRAHHVDLLAHQPDSMLYVAFFLTRSIEAVLRERAKSPADTPEKLAQASISTLNDYVGYRPIALLETRAQTEFYPHEKVCPIPMYFAGVGVAPGRYSDLIRVALDLLITTDANFHDEAGFDPSRLDELGIDPRAVDHFHPVSKRPNLLFGEWDPHRIDNRGNYRRFVLRQTTLDALMLWVDGGRAIGQSTASPYAERLFESAAVLAGTILMGAGVCGSGPTVYDSSVTLTTLVQRIAHYRDDFYRKLLESLPGPHGERLRSESAKRKQPFAGVRQFLNQSIAMDRATHLQERRLAIFFAAMGYAKAARERAAKIPAPSVRFGCAIRLNQTEAEFAAKAGRTADAARLLAEAEDMLRRGIDCGALIDPWNILGYQGLFPIFAGRDDTVRDPRSEELILTVGRQFDRYALALASGTDAGERTHDSPLALAMRRLADWWDAFATPTVTDMPRVLGGERTDAAIHVAKALALWKQAPTAEHDVGFWRKHRDGFNTPAAFAQVIEALLDQQDFKGSLSLLMMWLSEVDSVPLQDPSASFLRLSFRWLKSTIAASPSNGPLVRRFFELLEANADTLWQVPVIGASGGESELDEVEDTDDEDEDDNAFESAYEGMSYRDSADDGNEGALAESGPTSVADDFPLESSAERFETRLRFIAAVARMWRTSSLPQLWHADDTDAVDALTVWLLTAQQHRMNLDVFIERLHAIELSDDASALEGVMEYDRRRIMKGHLLDMAVSTAVEMAAAERALSAALYTKPELKSTENETVTGWSDLAVQLEQAILRGDTSSARERLIPFIEAFRREPLLVNPPADGGPPGPALRAQTALQMMESLLLRLPRLGLLRETYQLTKLSRAMERNEPPERRRVSTFDQLFRTAVTATVDALAGSAKVRSDGLPDDGPLLPALRQIVNAYRTLWIEHSQSLRLSSLEAVLDDKDWQDMKAFIRTYGGDLFTVRFLTLSNIRGILSQGVDEWLERMADPDNQADPMSGTEPLKLVVAWQNGAVDKPYTKRLLEIVLQALIEHYDEYRDYNTTTTQSDYGENLFILLDFLRLKVVYDRRAWRMKPMVFAHEMLCRRGHDRLAVSWRDIMLEDAAKPADELLALLAARETEHGIRVRTIRDRLEERFLHPLQIDRAVARVAPALAAVRDNATTEPENSPVFLSLLDAIQPLAASPSGVGLDVPVWLRKLEDELRKLRGVRSSDGDDEKIEDPLPTPNVRIDFTELQRQLAIWERPIDEDG